MRMTITVKMFLWLLVCTLAAILIMSGTVRYNFERGFLKYLNEADAARSTALVLVLADYYGEHGGWQGLAGDEERWREMLHQGYSPPIYSKYTDHARELDGAAGVAARVTLLDAGGDYVAGYGSPAQDAMRVGIRFNGATVGWLLIAPNTGLTDALAISFHREQNNLIYTVSAIAAVVVAIAAFVWSRIALRPIRRLAHGMHALTAGDYERSIPITSRDEIGQLSEDFNKLAETLRRNDRYRRQWVADFSHELRTPLAIMRGEIEAMQDGVRPIDRKGVDSLHADVLLLQKLIEDLYNLSLADLGALTYRKERVNVLGVLARTVQSFSKEYAKAGISIENTIPPEARAIVFADEARLGQLFINLLQNALRYTDAGGQLRLSWERTPRHVTLNLQDSAPGVPEEALARLTERLFRANESRSRASGGAGLGLAICKTIVDAHDGTIEALASPLGGVWMRVRLPLDRSRQARREAVRT